MRSKKTLMALNDKRENGKNHFRLMEKYSLYWRLCLCVKWQFIRSCEMRIIIMRFQNENQSMIIIEKNNWNHLYFPHSNGLYTHKHKLRVWVQFERKYWKFLSLPFLSLFILCYGKFFTFTAHKLINKTENKNMNKP